MKIIEPEVELWKQGEDVDAHVAKCARVCYNSDTTAIYPEDTNKTLIKNLVKAKHFSMFRHETVYTIIKRSPFMIRAVLGHYFNSPYIHWVTINDKTYIVTNGQFYREMEKENPVLYSWLSERVSPDEFKKHGKDVANLMRYTFKVVTQISTSRELNRVSPNNISELSTRFVKNTGVIVRPYWIPQNHIENYDKGLLNINELPSNSFEFIEWLYLKSCEKAFDIYSDLISAGVSRGDARGILPLDTATICIYTYSINEWKHIIDLRYYGKTGTPHHNCQIVVGMIKDLLSKEGYCL